MLKCTWCKEQRTALKSCERVNYMLFCRCVAFCGERIRPADFEVVCICVTNTDFCVYDCYTVFCGTDFVSVKMVEHCASHVFRQADRVVCANKESVIACGDKGSVYATRSEFCHLSR